MNRDERETEAAFFRIVAVFLQTAAVFFRMVAVFSSVANET